MTTKNVGQEVDGRDQESKGQKETQNPQISIPPIRKADRSWEKRDSEDATTYAEHLEQVLHHFLT
jgi:hypothetical protein